MKKRVVVIVMIVALIFSVFLANKDSEAIKAEENISENIVSMMLNMTEGFELKNKYSGRMLSLQHGENKDYQKDGSKFDTYPADGTIT